MDFRQRRRLETGQAAQFGQDAQLGQEAQLGQTAPARQQQGQVRSTRAVRTPRHAGIFEAVHRLDAGLDAVARAELSRWVREEYEKEFGDVPLGFFAQCHLGPPYVDHRLDLWQSITDHYAPADLVPEPYARARPLARSGAYDFIEVYASGELKPVLRDGSVVA